MVGSEQGRSKAPSVYIATGVCGVVIDIKFKKGTGKLALGLHQPRRRVLVFHT